jgi:hypothetical protein
MRPDGVRHPEGCGREAVAVVLSGEVILALHLSDAVGLPRIGVVVAVSCEVFTHWLDIAALVDRHRAREHELLHPTSEERDQGLEIGDSIGGVVEHDIELVFVVSQDVLEDTRLAPVTVQPAGSVGERRHMAVEHGDVVTTSGELEHEMAPDVPVAAENKDSHR